MKNRKRHLKSEKPALPGGSAGSGASRVPPPDGNPPSQTARTVSEDRRASQLEPRLPSQPRYRPHDFRRPRPLTERQLRALDVLHGKFAESLGAAFSALVRSRVQVTLNSVSQGRYFDFIRSLPSPTGLHLVHCYPLRAPLVLEMSLGTLVPMIERILGGKGDLVAQPTRPLTRIEQGLAASIACKLLGVLTEAWSQEPELRLDLAEMEHNPLLMQIVGPAEPTVVLTFGLSLGIRTGEIHLALPLKPFETLLSRLACNATPGGGREGNTDRERERILKRVSGTQLTLAAELPPVPIRLQDLLTLQPGDIIDTQIPLRSEVSILLEGHRLFRGLPATQDGHRVVKVTRGES